MTMLSKWIVCILCVLFIPLNNYSQESGLKGKILDKESGDVLIGANVSIGGLVSITGVDGMFSIGLKAGLYELVVSYVGYEEHVQDIEIRSGQYEEIELMLSFSANILETATVSGSRHQKSLARSPVSISVIKPQLIENTNTIRVTSVLDKIPGVQIIDNQANIRGGSGWSYGAGSRVLLLVDDIPALQADAGRPNWADIPVENISQIEVLKGASSTLYGSAALNGIINVRTGYATSEPITKASISYRSYMSPKDKVKQWWTSAPSRLNLGLLHKQKFGDLDLVANAFYEDFDSYIKDGYDNKIRLSANAKYRLSDRISFGLNTMLNIGESASHFIWANGSNGIYDGFDGTYSTSESNRFYVDPQMTIYDKEGNRHKILGRYYYIDNNNNNDQGNSSNSYYTEYQFSKNITDTKINLTAGAVVYLTDSEAEYFEGGSLKHSNAAAYLEVDKEIIQDLTLTAGMRLEYNKQMRPESITYDTVQTNPLVVEEQILTEYKDDESKLITRLGLNYKLSEGTFLRTSWGQGYRYPTMVERFIETSTGAFNVFANESLESETGWSAELGIKQGLKIGSWEGFLDLSVFWSQYSNMTEFSLEQRTTQDSVILYGFQSKNVGETDIKGFEAEWVGRSILFGVPLNIMAGYTYLNPRYKDFENNTAVYNSISVPVGSDEKENILKYRNKHNFKIDIEAFVNRISAGLSYNYTSATITIDQLLGNLGQIRLYREANPGGFNRMDARVAYNFGVFKCSFLVENLLNEEISLRPGLLEAPRSVSMRLDFNI